MFARFICIEGPDKVGKHTQSRMLAHGLRFLGRDVSLVEVPVNDALTYKIIYRMLKTGQAKTHPKLFQFVQFLNKFIFQCTKLVWLWLMYDYVIFDRWRLSSIIYGDATGVNPTFTRVLCLFLKKPDTTVVLHGSSFKRQEADDVYEKDDDIQKYVRKGYDEWVTSHLRDHDMISNDGSKNDVYERVFEAVRLYFMFL